MKALLSTELPTGREWTYEIKFDGVRALGIKKGGVPALLSRAGNELGLKYPRLLGALGSLGPKNVVVDGEIVALDPEGRPSFQLLQSRHLLPKKPPLVYYIFDLLNLDGRDLRGLPLWRRKALLKPLLENVEDSIRFSRTFEAEGPALVREIKVRGLEGLVAKLRESTYESGRRSGAWVKFKWSNEQEFVIGGYTRPKGARSHFGAILVGYYEGGRLLFAGKVGTGFDQKLLASLSARFEKLVRANSPFADLPQHGFGTTTGIPRSAMRLCTWLEPKLVCQVRFAEWTRDGRLRQPAFLGLREDKQAKGVVRERAA